VHLPYRVSAQDPEVLLVKARTQTCDCRWYLELDWSSQGRTGTLRVDDHGKPFRTSGIKGLPHYWYVEHGWDRTTVRPRRFLRPGHVADVGAGHLQHPANSPVQHDL
jgi:hypothetical protein